MHSVNISLFFAAFSFIVNINARNVNEEKPRLFGYSYTTTVIKPHIITSFIPSSCVQVDATLPPCRIMRSFSSFPSLEKSRSLTSSLNTTIMTPKEDKVQTTPLSWGEYLGIYAPTVTVTSTQVIITTVVDPGVQVTYAIKGCKPKVLPAGLERCALSNEEENKR
nr:uncharacterized protein LOC111421395 [Onthophagus taurus]